MNDKSKLIEKLKKLMAMADPAGGATDAEMQTAMAAAQRLMTEHGIDAVEVMDRKTSMDDIMHDASEFGRREHYSDNAIMVIIMEMLPIRMLKSHYYSQNANGRPEKFFKVIYIGQADQVACAMLFYGKLREAFFSGMKRYLKRTGQKWNADLQRGYDRGLRQGFVERNREAKSAAMAAANADSTSRYALVLVDVKKVVDQYVDKTFRVTVTQASKKAFDHNAFAQGKLDGASLSLHDKVGNGVTGLLK